MSIRKLPSGSFQVRRSIGGRSHTKTFPSRKEAEEYEAQLTHGGQTLAEWLVIWFDLHRPSIKQGTIVTYKSVVNTHVMEKIGGIPLEQLTVADLSAWQADLLDGDLSPRTVQLARAILKTALDVAVEHGEIEANPLDKVRAPKASRRREIVILSDEQLSRLYAEMHPKHRLSIWLGGELGLRPGEILGLRVEDIDLENSVLHVRHTLKTVPGQGTYLETPKTELSARTLDLPEFMVEMIKQHIADGHCLDHKGQPSKHGQLIVAKWGGWLPHTNYVRQAWRPACDATGLDPSKYTPHVLRHTAASRWLLDRAAPQLVADMLGHANPNFTMRIYAHVFDDTGKQFAASRRAPAMLELT